MQISKSEILLCTGGLVKRLKKDSSSCSPLKADGKLINDTYGKAEALNEQSQSVFNPTTHSTLPDMGPSSFPSVKNVKFSVVGILKLLQDMKIHKAPGPDKIVPRLLHEFAHILAEPLVEICKTTSGRCQKFVRQKQRCMTTSGRRQKLVRRILFKLLNN